MSAIHKKTASISVLLIAFSTAGRSAVTTESLLVEFVNLETTTRFPSPYFTSLQASSYQRNSWFGNHDYGSYIRSETNNGRTENVMMDVVGAGAVVSIWTANASGVPQIPPGSSPTRLIFYIDSASSPTYDVNFADLVQGRVEPLVEQIAYSTNPGLTDRTGGTIYFPFTFSKACKITTTAGSGCYYHIDYRLYEETTAVEPFRQSLLTALDTEIRNYAAVLNNPESAYASSSSCRQKSFNDTVPAGSSITVTLEGFTMGSVIRQLSLRPSIQETDLQDEARLEIAFDGQECVNAPLWTFFSSGTEVEDFNSIMMKKSADGTLTSRIPMPFRSSASLRIYASETAALTVSGRILIEAYEWDCASMYFHADTRSQDNISTASPLDWNFIVIHGTGVYLGNTLKVHNYSTGPITWWGEGDEKIFIDGDEFPSWFGTGTEDYYNQSWGIGLSTRPYTSVTDCPCTPDAWFTGQSIMNRFHVPDPIVFRDSLKFDMEIWHNDRATTVDYSVVNYWYMLPDTCVEVGARQQRGKRGMCRSIFASAGTAAGNPLMIEFGKRIDGHATLTGLDGRLVRRIPVEGTRMKIGTCLASGTYVLRITDAHGVTTQLLLCAIH